MPSIEQLEKLAEVLDFEITNLFIPEGGGNCALKVIICITLQWQAPVM